MSVYCFSLCDLQSRSSCVKTLQNTIVAYEAYKNELKWFRKLETEHGNCAEKICLAQEQAATNLKIAKDA